MLAITQVKSANGTNARQRATLESLGLRRIGHTVERPESLQLLGMLHAVRHLVSVETPGRGSTGDAGASATTRSGADG